MRRLALFRDRALSAVSAPSSFLRRARFTADAAAPAAGSGADAAAAPAPAPPPPAPPPYLRNLRMDRGTLELIERARLEEEGAFILRLFAGI